MIKKTALRTILATTLLCGLASMLSAAHHEGTNFTGIWQLTDENGEPFYLELRNDRTAHSTYAKGPNGALGEAGVWRMDGDRAMISYDTGWVDIIQRSGQGYEKLAYDNGVSLSGAPSNRTIAVRTGPAKKSLYEPVPESMFVGYWKLLDEKEETFYLHVKSDHTAQSTYAGGKFGIFGEHGTWRWETNRILIAYDSGWVDVLIPVGKEVVKFSYAPGQKVEGTPDNTSKALRADPAEVKR